ncbi:YoaK family protein [Roseateles sp. P5_E1]
MSRARPALLAMAAAYVDTCGFIGLFGLFTAHVTGNFVLIGAELVNRHVDILTKSLALPVFILSVVLANQAEAVMRRRGMAATTWLLGVLSLLIALAALAPGWAGLPQHPDDLPSVVIGFLLIAAIGVQNALMRTSLAGPVQTTVMTGNVTQLTIDLLAVATGRADAGTRTRAAALWPVVMAFAAGSALGAIGYAGLSFNCLWLACALVAGAAWIAHRQEPKETSARSAI